jgi:RHS repeat-associated protein
MVTTYYHWHPTDDCVTYETDGAGATTVTYNHEPGQFGLLLSETRGTTTYTHHYDALGSTTALTDDAGNVTDTYLYDAWGLVVRRTGTLPTPYQWVGRQGYLFDLSTERYYIRARVFSPTIARWTSMDPLASPPRTMRQIYAINPLTFVDPSGLMSVIILKQHLNLHCGGLAAYMEFNFRLDEPATAKGWFVQKMVIRCKDGNCADCPDTSDTHKFVFYEAFDVKAGQFTDDAAITTGYSDEWNGASPAEDTCGVYSRQGILKFFYEADMNGETPADWEGFEDECVTSGAAPATSNRPSWWNMRSEERSESRWMSEYWNCCRCRERFASGDAWPRLLEDTYGDDDED